MAACQGQAGQPQAAIKSYQMAEKLAHQTGLAKLESVADVNRAQLEGKDGNINEALQAYRAAIALDDATSDKAASAVDWFAYGQFLDQSGFPARMTYACMVKSESMGQSLSDKGTLASIVEARQKFEKRLGREAAEIRRNPVPALQESLRVQH
jgi:tetratricopeptide (TPR) repeat protein